VTADLTAVTAGKGAGPLAIVELVIIAGWVLFFAVMLIYAAVLFTARGRRQRQRQAQRRPRAGPRIGTLPPGVDDLRRVDPGFDEQCQRWSWVGPELLRKRSWWGREKLARWGRRKFAESLGTLPKNA